MCINCVKEEFPDRESLCVEHGSYLANFKECYNCGGRNLKMVNNAFEEVDGEELITYEHACAECDHVIAVHEHTFRVEEEYQNAQSEQVKVSRRNKRSENNKQIHHGFSSPRAHAKAKSKMLKVKLEQM